MIGLIFEIPKSVIHCICRIKEKNHIIFSIVAEQAFEKIQHAFIIKTLTKLRIKGNFLSQVNGISENLHLTT